jgi:hypothetical protein
VLSDVGDAWTTTAPLFSRGLHLDGADRRWKESGARSTPALGVEAVLGDIRRDSRLQKRDERGGGRFFLLRFGLIAVDSDAEEIDWRRKEEEREH